MLRRNARLIAAATGTVVSAFALNPHALAQQYFDVNGSSPGLGMAVAGGAGTWDTTTPNWNDATGTGAPATWVQGGNPFFSGNGGTVTLGTPINAGTITMGGVNAAGAFTFIGSAVNTLTFNQLIVPAANNVTTTFSGGVAGTDFNILDNNAASIANNVTIGGVNTFSGDVNITGTQAGTTSASRLAFNINTIGAVPATADFNFGRSQSQVNFNVAGNHGTVPNNINLNTGNVAGTFEGWIGALNGATVNLTGLVSGNGSVVFGLGVSGGAGVVTLSNANTYTGNTRFLNAPTGVVRVGVTNALPATTGLTFGSGATPSGSLDLNGNNQTVASLASAVTGNGTVNGIVNTQAAQSTLTIKGSATTTYSGALGSATNAANLPNAGNHANIRLVLDAANTGSLTLNGPLTGMQVAGTGQGNAYTGGTAVDGGTLLVGNATGSATGTGAVTVAAAARLGSVAGNLGIISGNVDNAGTLLPGGVGTIGKLTLTGGLTAQANSNINLDLGVVGTGDLLALSAPVDANTLLTPGGAQSVNINFNDVGGIDNGVYPLIDYTDGSPFMTAFNASPTGPLKVTAPTQGAASQATFALSNDGVGMIFVTVSGVADRITWRGGAGGSGTWETTPANTVFDLGGTPVAFTEPDEVTFDDTANAGDVPAVVTIAGGGVSPGKVTVNAARNYTFTGGPINGTTQIVKSGTGTLVLGSNNHTGGTVVTNGTLRIDGDSDLGAVPASPTINLTVSKTVDPNTTVVAFDAPVTLAANRTIRLSQSVGGGGPSFNTNGNSVTILGKITGSVNGVNLIKSGAGTLTLRGDNSTAEGGGTVNGVQIQGGLINVAADNNLGQANGGILMSGGGGLQLAGSFPLGTRTLNMTNAGGGGNIDTNGFNTSTNGPLIGAHPFTKNGAGTLSLTGTNTHTGGVTVAGGTLELKRLHAEAFTVNAGTTLRVLESSPGVSSGHPSGDNASVSRPTALTIDPAGFLDLTNNDLIIDYTGASPAAAYEQLVRSAYNVTGDWQGPGITSSIAANDGNYVVAIADNALLAAPFGTAQGGPLFAGVDVDLDTILIKFTHRADINLDGVITPDDSAVFGGNYDEGAPAVWATGDMNYDGIYTPDDAAIFGGAYDESLASLPEPANLVALGLFGLLAARRSRRATR